MLRKSLMIKQHNDYRQANFFFQIKEKGLFNNNEQPLLFILSTATGYGTL